MEEIPLAASSGSDSPAPTPKALREEQRKRRKARITSQRRAQDGRNGRKEDVNTFMLSPAYERVKAMTPGFRRKVQPHR